MCGDIAILYHLIHRSKRKNEGATLIFKIPPFSKTASNDCHRNVYDKIENLYRHYIHCDILGSSNVKDDSKMVIVGPSDGSFDKPCIKTNFIVTDKTPLHVYPIVYVDLSLDISNNMIRSIDERSSIVLYKTDNIYWDINVICHAIAGNKNIMNVYFGMDDIPMEFMSINDMHNFTDKKRIVVAVGQNFTFKLKTLDSVSIRLADGTVTSATYRDGSFDGVIREDIKADYNTTMLRHTAAIVHPYGSNMINKLAKCIHGIYGSDGTICVVPELIKSMSALADRYSLVIAVPSIDIYESYHRNAMGNITVGAEIVKTFNKIIGYIIGDENENENSDIR